MEQKDLEPKRGKAKDNINEEKTVSVNSKLQLCIRFRIDEFL